MSDDYLLFAHQRRKYREWKGDRNAPYPQL